MLGTNYQVLKSIVINIPTIQPRAEISERSALVLTCFNDEGRLGRQDESVGDRFLTEVHEQSAAVVKTLRVCCRG